MQGKDHIRIAEGDLAMKTAVFSGRASLFIFVLLLAACSSTQSPPAGQDKRRGSPPTSSSQALRLPPNAGQEVAMRALGLIDVGYTFGGANPEAGLDCSGLVRYVYAQAAGVSLPHNAAQISQLARLVSREQLRPGDLVFFNTLGKPRSHVGIYIGDGRFVHAPNSRGKVRVESMTQPYYLSRFEGGGSFLVD